MKLEVRDLEGGYGSRPVLDGVSFDVASGSIVTLLGANGCGKSTLLKLIGRILKPSAGEIRLDGQPLQCIPTGELARQLAILPQLHHASGEVTVEELVAFGRFPHRRRPGGDRYGREIIARAIATTRLEPLRRRPLGTLSGGERQRAWLAMTLAQEPRLLLLDEPTTFLDICCQFEILELVKQLNRSCGITVLMVLHDLNLAASYSDRLLMIKERRVRHAGTPREVMTPAILREVFEIEANITMTDAGTPYCLATGSAREGQP